MAFVDFFDCRTFLTPEIYYEATIFIRSGENEQILPVNATITSNGNKYADFIEKYYFSIIKRSLNGRLLESYLRYCTFPEIGAYRYNETGEYTRLYKLRYDRSQFFYFILLELLDDNENDRKNIINMLDTRNSYDDFINFFRDRLRNKRKKLQDVESEGSSSKNYSEVKTLVPMQEGEKIDAYISRLKSQCALRANECTSAIRAVRLLKDLFTIPIDIDALIACFEYDQFCLILAKCLLDNKYSDFGSRLYVEKYLAAVKEYREKNPSYNCSIQLISSATGRKYKYSIADLERDYNRYLVEHPEQVGITITSDEIRSLLTKYGYSEEFIANFDLNNKQNKELYVQLLDTERKMQTLLRSWKIFPKGTKTPTDDAIKVLSMHGNQLEEDEKIRRMLESYKHLEASNYLFKIEGINEFEGYIGYIYPSGRVIYEKFYDDVEKHKVASDCATYIINDFKMFVEISKMSRSEIINKRKNGELRTIVERVYHRKDMNRWRAKIDAAINGDDYTPDVLQFIEQLIAKKELGRHVIK